MKLIDHEYGKTTTILHHRTRRSSWSSKKKKKFERSVLITCYKLERIERENRETKYMRE